MLVFISRKIACKSASLLLTSESSITRRKEGEKGERNTWNSRVSPTQLPICIGNPPRRACALRLSLRYQLRWKKQRPMIADNEKYSRCTENPRLGLCRIIITDRHQLVWRQAHYTDQIQILTLPIKIFVEQFWIKFLLDLFFITIFLNQKIIKMGNTLSDNQPF